jgi:hypothetical protein
MPSLKDAQSATEVYYPLDKISQLICAILLLVGGSILT